MHDTNPFFDDGNEGVERRNVHEDEGVPSSESTPLFPGWLSSWMTRSPSPYNQGDVYDEEDGDDSLYHDCISLSLSSSTIEELNDETTSLLANGDNLSPLHQRTTFSTYNATTPFTPTPIRSNNSGGVNSGATATSNMTSNSNKDSIYSPLSQALATWLSPYADSAKRAGRQTLYCSEDAEGTRSNHHNSNDSDNANNSAEETPQSVRFTPDYKKSNGGRKRLGSLSRAISSPALIQSKSKSLSNETWSSGAGIEIRGIVLKDIDMQGESNDSDDCDFIHPWTKLILLEELGTAWSWFVLLLPYVFLILAVLLDGDTLKNTIVGPLWGNTTCAEMVRGSVPTPFDESVKGYYPVPFRFAVDGNHSGSDFHKSCSYPFELREGVGLLSHGKDIASNLTLSSLSSVTHERTSILNARYRYLMSHGHAVTSGVIPNVPPTSQSLRGSVKFNNLSSRALALVARGSVLVSAVVFQSPHPNDSHDTNNSTSYNTKKWSPVLILSAKRLDMNCKLNKNHGENDALTWTCSSHRIIDAFFSLPNTDVLTGGDLRIDILLSHHKTQKSLSDSPWFNERGGVMGGVDDDYAKNFNDNLDLPEAEKILLAVPVVSHPQMLLSELSTKSVYKIEHQSVAYSNVVEITRMFSLTATIIFLCFWWYSMGISNEDSAIESTSILGSTIERRFLSPIYKLYHQISRRLKRNNQQTRRFWWQDPWSMFPERRFLLLLLFCLIMLQNPLLACAFFHPSLYSSSRFRFAADSLSGVSVHGILFLWLCLVHGLRYHTADISRRRLSFHRRILELRKATTHISTSHDIENNQWGGVHRYYQQYGDIEGGFNAALKMKHDINSDSFVEFMFPKVVLLIVGIAASVAAAASRFPMSDSSRSISDRIELNPDRFGSLSKVYVGASIVQVIVILIWGIFIVYTSFVTGERLKREPFLSTRPAQLAFRVLSSILLLGLGFSVALFYFHSINLLGNESDNAASESEIIYDTSIGVNNLDESWDTRADLLITLIRRATTELPYVGTASNIGPGKILYATACSLVVAHIFLPSSHFHPSKKDKADSDEYAMGPDQAMLSDLDKKYQGKDKRFVVALARNTHTWRVFPLPTRSHALISQHTLKEQLNILGTLQLYFDGRHFHMHQRKLGRGAIYKGKYIPVFCVEIACWLLEVSWQAYYSPFEYSRDNWAPGRMRLDRIGLKLERYINDSETDTHAFVASNISEQVEGEIDSVIVISFRGSASSTNIKTDLSFRQVPLSERIMSDIPAFNIRPGKSIAVDESLWDTNEPSLPSMVQDILHGPSGKYTSRPTSAEESSDNSHPVELDQSIFMPTVSNGAKAIIRATPMARQALPCVHEGFLQNYSRIRHDLIETIVSVLKRQLDKSIECSQYGKSSDDDGATPVTLPKIYITGHSMGGSLAQLLALDLASNCEIVIEQAIAKDKGQSSGGQSRQSLSSLDDEDAARESLPELDWLGQRLSHQSRNRIATKKIRLRPPIAVYTYGQSRVGNNAFKAIYKKRVPHTFRVSTEGDAITTMPTLGPFCGGVYRHAGLEVLLEQGCTGNILVGPTVVETLLRFTKVRTSMAAHSLERYRDSLESALNREELKEYYRGHGGKVRHDIDKSAGYTSNTDASLPSWVTSVKRSHDV